MKGWIIGNGPSRNEWDYRNLNGIVYGCNTLYEDCLSHDWLCDYMVVSDPWYQFDVVASEYPLRGECLFFNYHPVPVVPGILGEMLDPSVIMGKPIEYGYEQYYHNPQHKANAIEYIYYATSAENWENYTARGHHKFNYWGPNKAYVCWVPEGSKINLIESDVLGHMDSIPSGAWALDHALLNDAIDTIEVIGFDSLSGIYNTTSNIYFDGHEEEEHGKDWVKYYDMVIEARPKKDITWHTKKD